MILGNLGHNDPNSDSGDSNGVELFRFGPSFWLRKIVTKSPLSRHGLPQATFRGYPPKIHRKSTEKIAKLSESWAESGDLLLLPKAKKKHGGRSAMYFLLLGGRFSRQSSGLVDLKNRTTNVCSFTKRIPAKRQNKKMCQQPCCAAISQGKR